MTAPIRRRERTAQRHSKPAVKATAGSLDAEVWRRRAAAWPEYETELLAHADEAENNQTAAA